MLHAILMKLLWAYLIWNGICLLTLRSYGPLFAHIQIVSKLLEIVGYFAIAYWAISERWKQWDKIWHWTPKVAWLWDNEEDGIFGGASPNAWNAWYWSAWRNSVHNLDYVRGVSKVGRPLWQVKWRKWYAQMGWNNVGRPVLSAGSS